MKTIVSVAAAAVFGLGLVSAAQAQSYGPTVDYQHHQVAPDQTVSVFTGRSVAARSDAMPVPQAPAQGLFGSLFSEK